MLRCRRLQNQIASKSKLPLLATVVVEAEVAKVGATQVAKVGVTQVAKVAQAAKVAQVAKPAKVPQVAKVVTKVAKKARVIKPRQVLRVMEVSNSSSHNPKQVAIKNAASWSKWQNSAEKNLQVNVMCPENGFRM